MSVILICDKCGDGVCRHGTRNITPSPCNVRGCGGMYRVRGETRGKAPLEGVLTNCGTYTPPKNILPPRPPMRLEDLMQPGKTVYLPRGASVEGFLPLTDSLHDRAWRWMHSPGGRHVMRDLFALAAKYVPRWRRTGIPVSVAMLWEIERQRIKEVTARAVRMGFRIKDEYGYTLNNSYRAYVARHIMDRRRDWAGLFETRELKA